MLMENIVPSIRIVVITKLIDVGVVEEILLYLVKLEEDWFVAWYHQTVEKARYKSWHDRHIKNKKFLIGDIILLYDIMFLKNPSKLQTHWMGPYFVFQFTKRGAVKLQKLDGTPFKGLVNGSWLKPYQGSCASVDW